jgi:hypothetical protein
MLPKMNNSRARDDGLDRKRAFQYALSSRTYWKILEFLPFFGVKGKQVMGSLAAGYDAKMTTFCA